MPGPLHGPLALVHQPATNRTPTQLRRHRQISEVTDYLLMAIEPGT
jgi:hypothetical protein